MNETRGWGLGPKGPFLSVLTGRRGGEHLSDTGINQMNMLPQFQLVLIIRALSFYLEDLLKNEDYEAATEVAKLLSEASHSIKRK